ncbi:hypothetical protein SFIMM107S_03202 [Streptomyces griseus]
MDTVLQGQFEPRRQGVPREADDSPAAGLVARQFRFLQQQAEELERMSVAEALFLRNYAESKKA